MTVEREDTEREGKREREQEAFQVLSALILRGSACGGGWEYPTGAPLTDRPMEPLEKHLSVETALDAFSEGSCG